MPQRKVFVATGILALDFELFIGGRVQKDYSSKDSAITLSNLL
jgi:hypothetical protein